MNNKWRILLASLTASIMLAACGTAEPEAETEDTTGNAVEEPAEIETDVEEDTASETEVDVEAEAETDDDALADAVETKSDEQDYSMMVMPGYNLISEEPGRDSLLSDENSDIFMRIETVVKDDESYSFDEYYDNMQELLMASSAGATPTDLSDADLPQTDGAAVKGSEVESAEGYFRGYVMDLEEKLVRVTIYSSEDDEHIEDFKKMAATIK